MHHKSYGACCTITTQCEKVDTNIIPKQIVLILLTANPHLRFLWEEVDLNTKPHQNLNDGNLTL